MSLISLDRFLLSHVDSSIKIGDGTNFLALDGSGYITANINGSVTVTASDLDIRDLIYTSDSVTAHQGGSWSVGVTDGVDALAINSDGSINVNLTDDGIADDAADAGNPLKVGGRGHDQSTVLAALSAGGDRFDLLGDLYRRIFIADYANIGMVGAAVSVGLTEVNLVASPLAGRKEIVIQNKGSVSIYVGPTGVTTSNGIEIGKNSSATFQMGEALDLYAISTVAAQDVRVLELA